MLLKWVSNKIADQWFGIVLIIGLCGINQSCSTISVKKLNFNIQAVEYLNIDIEGNPAPVVISIYQLSNTAMFEQANYFAIVNAAAKTLGAALLEEQELEIRPGENRLFTKNLIQGANYLGIVAGFRDLDQALWRQVVKLPMSKKIHVKIDVTTLGIKVTAD